MLDTRLNLIIICAFRYKLCSASNDGTLRIWDVTNLDSSTSCLGVIGVSLDGVFFDQEESPNPDWVWSVRATDTELFCGTTAGAVHFINVEGKQGKKRKSCIIS